MPLVALRTADFDRQRRVAEFQNTAAHMCRLDILPAADAEFRSETVIGVLPDLVIADTSHSACITTRTHRLAAETGDNVLIHMPLSGGFTIAQDGGGEFACGPGDIYLDPSEMPGIAAFRGEAARVLYASIPRVLLAAGTTGLNAGLRRAVPMTPQWHLFASAVHDLHAAAGTLAPSELARRSVHVQDLALLALGADGEARRIAAGRGLRSARLAAIKADIEAHLTDPRLDAGFIAARHRISPRYIRALFADEDGSFNDHVVHRRLLLAYRCLTDPDGADSVSRIAMETGFGDLSWFNARFKRLFGVTPREARARGRAGTDPHIQVRATV